MSSFTPQTHTPHKHPRWIWYILGGLIVCTCIGFIGLIGYYWWQIQFGGEATVASLQTRYESAFSALSSERGPTTIDNPDQLIQPHNPTIGPADAPVTIIAFIDFECPYCQRAYPMFESIREQFGPIIRIVFKHFPLTSIHPNAEAAAIAAQCAHAQGQFWPMYTALFEGQNFESLYIDQYAASIGLDLQTFFTCQKQPSISQTIFTDVSDGINIAGVRGTPTYIVNGTKYEGVVPEAEWKKIILTALNSSTE